MTVTFMTFEEAKTHQQKLDEKCSIDSAKLNTFPKNEIGLTPDLVRETPDFQQAKKAFEKSFAELRNFNKWYSKEFKKELAAERKNRYKKK
jgi:hypothetical protein